MYDQKPNRKWLWIGLIVVAFIAAAAILALSLSSKKTDQAATTTSDQPSAKASRQDIALRRKTLMGMMSIIKTSYKTNQQYPPVSEVASVIKARIGSVPLDPVSKSTFTFIASSPQSSNQVEYVIGFTCTSNNYALKPGIASDLAMLVTDDLSRYFCLSSRVIK